MKTSTAHAAWEGALRDGKGTMKLDKGGYEGPYSFASRFAESEGTNPEEMLAAAHAGCFTMAVTADLGRAGLTPNRISTEAKVSLDTVNGLPTIVKIELTTEGDVPNIDEATFQKHANDAKANCVISRALAGSVEITLNAKLK